MTKFQAAGGRDLRRARDWCRLHTDRWRADPVRVSEVAAPRPGDQLTVGGETFIIQGGPERRDPDRIVWMLDTRPA